MKASHKKNHHKKQMHHKKQPNQKRGESARPGRPGRPGRPSNPCPCCPRSGRPGRPGRPGREPQKMEPKMSMWFLNVPKKVTKTSKCKCDKQRLDGHTVAGKFKNQTECKASLGKEAKCNPAHKMKPVPPTGQVWFLNIPPDRTKSCFCGLEDKFKPAKEFKTLKECNDVLNADKRCSG